MIKIVTDSTCDLSPEQLQRHDIRVAPISIQFGTETYEEDIDIDRDLFYKKIDELGIIPTTSQPSPGRFADYYRELTEQGHSILSIAITSKHSGTYQSAVLAKDMVPEADVEGQVYKIAPKSKTEEGATLFDVEIALRPVTGVTLRAGYSANAEIVVQSRENVLLLPERLVSFADGQASVEVPGPSEEDPPVGP